MNNKIDLFIENRMKEKIKKEINRLSNMNYNDIIKQLSSKYDKEKIIEVLNELNIKAEEKLNLPQLEKKDEIKKPKKSFSLFKKKVKTKEDINSKYDKTINEEKKESINLPKLEKKEEIKKPKKIFSLFKKKVKSKEDITSKYDKIFNEEKKEKRIKKSFIKESPRLSIAILMIILFVISLSYVLIANQEKGRGTCPHVSTNDIRKLSNIFYEERDSFTFIEYDEIIGSYFGKNNCMTINRRTITKLRNL